MAVAYGVAVVSGCACKGRAEGRHDLLCEDILRGAFGSVGDAPRGVQALLRERGRLLPGTLIAGEITGGAVKKPKYLIEAWQEDEWWLAKVVGVAGGSDISPLTHMTQASTYDTIEDMARDLVATVLDADEDTFDIEIHPRGWAW